MEDSINDRMENFRNEMNGNLPCSQTGPCIDHPAKWSFVSEHEHSSKEKLEVWQLGGNLHQPSAKTKSVKKKSSKKRSTP